MYRILWGLFSMPEASFSLRCVVSVPFCRFQSLVLFLKGEISVPRNPAPPWWWNEMKRTERRWEKKISYVRSRFCVARPHRVLCNCVNESTSGGSIYYSSLSTVRLTVFVWFAASIYQFSISIIQFTSFYPLTLSPNKWLPSTKNGRRIWGILIIQSRSSRRRLISRIWIFKCVRSTLLGLRSGDGDGNRGVLADVT